jgi:hypothetical protein
MAHKPNVENRWWVETTVKKPKKAKSEVEMPQLPVAMSFYQVARDYDQDRAKDDLTDNNLRIARQANPPQGDWVYVAMTEEHYPPHLIKRVKDEFRLPREARGIVLDHGRLVRLLICGPGLEDWMIDITLGAVGRRVRVERDVPGKTVQARGGGASPGPQVGDQSAPVSAAAR